MNPGKGFRTRTKSGTTLFQSQMGFQIAFGVFLIRLFREVRNNLRHRQVYFPPSYEYFVDANWNWNADRDSGDSISRISKISSVSSLRRSHSNAGRRDRSIQDRQIRSVQRKAGYCPAAKGLRRGCGFHRSSRDNRQLIKGDHDE